MTTSTLNILLIGSGGREHTLAWALSKSKRVGKIFVAPGNGGTGITHPNVSNINISGSDFAGLTKFAQENSVGLLVVGPEQPLVDDIAAVFKKIGIPTFGPSGLAARMEGSKAFSKAFMKRWNIPTAEYESFTDFNAAKTYLEKFAPGTVVIKASGLAAGKGVLLPETKEEALEGLKQIMVDNIFGTAGSEVVLEERLSGQEVSVLAFSDGYSVHVMPPAQDHKRAYDGDQGPNTGGMGAYAPAPIATPELLKEVEEKVLKRAVDGMRKEGYPFVGVLYAGMMLDPRGPKVLEFNCRFGDPETQVILPLLSDDSDLAEICLACAEGRLDSVRIEFKKAFAATVVAAAHGYPGSYEKLKPITVKGQMPTDVNVFHAGTKLNADNTLVTNGGRVLTVTGVDSTLQGALQKAYAGLSQMHFEGMQFRKDIGWRALELLANPNKQKMTYADAGVSIDAGNSLVDRIKPLVRSTARTGSNSDIGLKGVFDLMRCGFKDPVLVSGTDGVGTKLKIAHSVGKHDTIGIDLVAMSVNDLLTQGAEPLFFLDYYATSKLNVDIATDVIGGICKGCVESNCALIGGETAEMPGFYQGEDYDLAGFAVGAAERAHLLPKLNLIQPGDALIGVPSSGPHSNGYSLIRRIVASQNLSFHSSCPFDPSKSMGEVLLTPTKLYVKSLMSILKTPETHQVKAVAHITGGGFLDNITRTIPDHCGIKIDVRSWQLPPVFKWLKKSGNVDGVEFARTFNCGIGMVLVVPQDRVNQVLASLNANGEPGSAVVGSVTDVSGDKRVDLQGLESWEL